MKIIRTNSENPDFKMLSALFDDYLVDIDGDERERTGQGRSGHAGSPPNLRRSVARSDGSGRQAHDQAREEARLCHL